LDRLPPKLTTWPGCILLRRAIFVAALAAACQTSTSPSLTHTFESPEEVARAVVRGFGEGNLAALQDLTLTESEFREIVWPKLPASRPERNLPMDYVWKDLAAKSDHHLRARLAEWKDRGFVFVALTFKGGVTDYGTYKVHRNTELRLRDRDGQESSGSLFGSIIEYKGRYKVFSYVVDR